MIHLEENSVSFSGGSPGDALFFCDMAGRKKQDDFAGPP